MNQNNEKRKRPGSEATAGKLRSTDAQLSRGSVTGVFTQMKSDNHLGKHLFQLHDLV